MSDRFFLDRSIFVYSCDENGERILSVSITSTTGSFFNLRSVYFSTGADEFEEIIPTPEPSALEGLLIGIGMLGFAGIKSRKLKLGT